MWGVYNSNDALVSDLFVFEEDAVDFYLASGWPTDYVAWTEDL